MLRRSGLSLTEILIVIVIVALLAALLVPVLTKARGRSKEVPCMTNLRQLHLAWSLYMQNSGDVMPVRLEEFTSLANETSKVLKCPADVPAGSYPRASNRMGAPVSYGFITGRPGFRDAISEADPNHGILYCVLHGQRIHSVSAEFSAERDTTGIVLRLRKDGSIQRAKVGHMCSPPSSQGQLRGRQHWNLLTDIPCVQPYCDGLTLPCPG
jgi:prepilin-type N-terminal cleavage/methylation domain-containing protein